MLKNISFVKNDLFYNKSSEEPKKIDRLSKKKKKLHKDKPKENYKFLRSF
jgi:hypothetical protein